MKTDKDPRRMERGDIARLANLLVGEIFPGTAFRIELKNANGLGVGGWSMPALAGHINKTTAKFVNALARKRRKVKP